MGMTGCWGAAQLIVPHVSHSVLYPTQPYSCYYNCSKPRWRGKTVQLKRRDLASVDLPSLTRSLPQEFFMTAGSGTHHYPTPPEIPLGTRNLHVVWFHCLNRNLWSQIENNQSHNGDIEMKCHMDSGELMSGCSSHVKVTRETGKHRHGRTVYLLDVNYNDHVSWVNVDPHVTIS